MKCYCGSGETYTSCCKPVIEGGKDAESPEKLMRARYSAYAAGKVGFLAATHDPAQKNDFDEEAAQAWADNAEWLGLEIVSSSGSGPGDSQGQVEFVARYREGGQEQAHHERSSFVKRSGKWYFSSGRMIVDQVVRGEQKTGRNDPCPCGSGKKYKKCCGS